MDTVAVVGLGYVGLPLAVEFGKKNHTIGFDLSVSKIESYKRHIDPTGEVSPETLRQANHLIVTTNAADLSQADYIIVAVPTPVDLAHQPDFSPLIGASEIVGNNMKKGAIVIYESTVYPGVTEEICIPVLEKHAKMKWQKDFNVGYSPERINPGDKVHTLTTILKVVSGDNADSLDKIAKLYERVITAGVYRASSIKVAEAAKVIENTQRDLNIALMNELAIIFDKLNIDTMDILDAAGTKWNFLPFRPGLVGGHCIGVDPYYLTHKAEMVGYMPQVILAGRRINDNMAKFVAEQTIKQIIKAGFNVRGARINVLGLTFKENCPDLRNSKVIDVIHELQDYGVEVNVHDPVVSNEEARHEYAIDLVSWEQLPQAEAMVVAVSHEEIIAKTFTDFKSKIIKNGCFIDVKSQFDQKELSEAGFRVWRL